TIEDYRKQSLSALKEPESFWKTTAKNYLWKKDWKTLTSGSFEKGDVKWFEEGVLNVTENIFERHQDDLEKIAWIWEPNDPKEPSLTITYQTLFEKVQQTANAFKSLGIKKGDVVGLYMPMIPETLFAALACARIG